MTGSAELLRAFRIEAREILEGLAEGLLDLEQNPTRVDVVHRCFRLAHTLKGAARVARFPRVAEISHAIEDALAPHRGGEAVLEPTFVSDLLALVGALEHEVAGVVPGQSGSAPAEGEGPTSLRFGEERLETVRVEIADLDATHAAVSEVNIQLGAARRGAEGLRDAQRIVATLLRDLQASREAKGGKGGAGSAGSIGGRGMRVSLEALERALASAQDTLGASLQRMTQEIGEVHRQLGALRLLPARTILPSLELSARDAALSQGVQVSFLATAEEVRLEGHILSAVRDALLHLVRNAIAHGIEPPDERLRLGKPAAGRVEITVARHGRRAVFVCSDDGRGMDAGALRDAAVVRGIVSPTEAGALDDAAALRLALRAGVSTSIGVTELSGRGVGLDVVAETASRFDGELRLASTPGQGTAITLEVALSLSSLAALGVRADDMAIAIPLTSVVAVARLADSEVLRDGGSESMVHEGRMIPFAPLAQVLGGVAVPPRPRWTAVIVRVEGALMGLGVDRLLGSAEVTVKPLPLAAGEHPLVAGAALDAQGDPVLVLDPRGLAPAIARMPAGAAPAGGPPRPPLLIIDDSLTTRMLEQGILEGAGYTVDLAGSGEEGLQKARERRYGLFIVDIEMPGMSGLDFLRITRADEALRDVPVIVVTSLATPEDRQRGLDAGASAYVVKGEFDQRRFVTTVGDLLARRP
ncbi:hybrid sensor histidine kinase/response regulator [Chondromyces apiculatus]|uniref:histidine kinase n=1 Tax=Chondromyces apiculatus DSM 436 TaxID=1192034 RepID=A0A017SVM4_9BACT|nr:response regulator [Chondromyces apiculatus]EYF01023.1 Signal transduction histidine kinase CheA [Chondromyces apiculatus DSM 436]